MPSTEKVERVAGLKARIEGSEALLLTDYRGLTVSEITELRASLREGGAQFSVIKNTLFKLAAIDAGIEGMDALLDGPAAVAFIHGDPVAAAKSVVAAAKKHPALELKGGFMEGHLLTAEQARALADLESREVMLSKIAGMMKSEMGRAASMFQATQARFLSLLEAFKEKLPAEEATAEEATAEEAVAGEAAVWEADQQAEPEQSTEEE